MNLENLNAILEDQAFVETLLAMESVAEVRLALQKKGVEMTEDDILAIRELLAKVESGEITLEQLKQIEDGELPEEALEQVTGGILISVSAGAFLALKLIGLIAGAAAAGGTVVGGYYAVRNCW